MTPLSHRLPWSLDNRKKMGIVEQVNKYLRHKKYKKTKSNIQLFNNGVENRLKSLFISQTTSREVPHFTRSSLLAVFFRVKRDGLRERRITSQFKHLRTFSIFFSFVISFVLELYSPISSTQLHNKVCLLLSDDNVWELLRMHSDTKDQLDVDDGQSCLRKSP